MPKKARVRSKTGIYHIIEKILHELKAINGVTIRQLARVIGVSKYIVEKA